MKCPSIYNFYRVYFGIPSSGKLQFALAIKDAQKQLGEMFTGLSFECCKPYWTHPYARQLTKTFLNNFINLAGHHYQHPFESLSYHHNNVLMAKEMLGTKVSLEIPFAYAYEPEHCRIIFFEYGKLDAVHQWQSVFRSLLTFKLTNEMPVYDQVVYWDLLKGSTRTIVDRDVTEAPVEMVKAAARRYIQLRGRI